MPVIRLVWRSAPRFSEGMFMRKHDPFRFVGVLLAAVALPVLGQAAANQTAAAPTAVPAAQAAGAPAAAQTEPLPNATHEDIGDSLEARQHYQAAIAAYAQDPHPSAAVWNKMGIAYQMMFNLKAATRCYKESLRLDEKNAMVYNNLGTVYDSMKNYSAAEKMYHKALKIAPKSPMILKNLGTNLLEQHKYSKGWRAYEAAMRLDPEIFEDHNNPTVANPTSIKERGAMNYFMARGCVRMGQVDCAMQYLRMAISEGYTTIKKVSKDADFASLRDNPAFKQLMAEEQPASGQQHP